MPKTSPTGIRNGFVTAGGGVGMYESTASMSSMIDLYSGASGPDAPEYKSIIELMDAVDSYIPTPPPAVTKPFLMPVGDVFGIKGRGTVVTGRIERGKVKIGDEIEILGFNQNRKTIVTGVEMFQKTLTEGEAGDNVGCLLRGV